jgi:hypothetical protein
MTTTATPTIAIAAATASSTGNAELSDYEVLRARNIERNNTRLRALGLISIQEERESNAIAWKKQIKHHTQDNDDNDDEKDEEEYTDTESPKKSGKRKASKSPTQASRKSSRLQGLQPEGSDVDTTVTTTAASSNSREYRQERVEECRQARQEAAVRMAAAVGGAAQAAKENPTATYEHCLMRVRTMSEKALQRRIQAIERATGKHCVVKMGTYRIDICLNYATTNLLFLPPFRGKCPFSHPISSHSSQQ